MGEATAWPNVSAMKGIKEVMVTIAVQVNGKLRGTIEVQSEQAKVQTVVVKQALGDERVKKWVVGKPKKVIFVPGRVINLIV